MDTPSLKKRTYNEVSPASTSSNSSPPSKARFQYLEHEVNTIVADVTATYGDISQLQNESYDVHSTSDAPEYFISAMQQIRGWLKPIDTIAKTLKNLFDAVQEAQSEACEAKKQAYKAKAEVVNLRLKVDSLEKETNTLQIKLNQCNQAIIDNENYNRRENLVFHGVTEEQNEKVLDKLFHIMSNMGIENPNEMKIQRCHRLDVQHMKPRPIIIRFQWFQD